MTTETNENEVKMTVRQKAFLYLEPWSSSKGFSLFVDGIVTAVILINVAALIVETVPELPGVVYTGLWIIELFSMAFFTIEYFMRIWVAPENPSLQKHRFPRLRYLITPFAVIDFFAILPFYLLAFLNFNVKFLLILRLFRLLKLVRYFKALQIMVRVFKSKSQELLIAVFFTLTILIFISFLMYYVEGPHQPDVFGSVPETFWWGIITLTTVGYGDVVPITPWGKFFGGIIAILGIGIFALPAGILASGFSTELEKITDDSDDDEPEASLASKVCPHCDRLIDT